MDGSRLRGILRVRAALAVLAVLAVLTALAACAGLGRAEEENTVPLRGPPLEDAPGPYTSRPPAGLPPEARFYLEGLSRAFAGGDGAFLLAQGEPVFEAEVRPRFDEETYLALLYRTGPLALDPGAGGDLPRLDYRHIRRLEYLGWEERGPLVEIQGRFIMAGGAPVPCAIVFNPRLEEIRVLGVFP
jgi:hypothetical protein